MTTTVVMVSGVPVGRVELVALVVEAPEEVAEPPVPRSGHTVVD